MLFIACNYPCLTCTGSALGCLTCVTTSNRVSVTDCNCKPHYYETLSECSICNYACANC